MRGLRAVGFFDITPICVAVGGRRGCNRRPAMRSAGRCAFRTLVMCHPKSRPATAMRKMADGSKYRLYRSAPELLFLVARDASFSAERAIKVAVSEGRKSELRNVWIARARAAPVA